MKKKIITLIVSVFFVLQVNAQNDKKNTLGVQINPYAKSKTEYGWNAALRYGKSYKEHLFLGVELYGNTYNNPSYDREEAGLSFVLRYNVINRPKARYFIEGAINFGVGNWTFKKLIQEYRTNFPYYQENSTYISLLHYYFAPGIQIPFAQNRFSLDLMLKISTVPLLFDAWKVAPSFRINYHF